MIFMRAALFAAVSSLVLSACGSHDSGSTLADAPKAGWPSTKTADGRNTYIFCPYVGQDLPSGYYTSKNLGDCALLQGYAKSGVSAFLGVQILDKDRLLCSHEPMPLGWHKVNGAGKLSCPSNQMTIRRDDCYWKQGEGPSGSYTICSDGCKVPTSGTAAGKCNK
jgi:hypothetical protein